MAKEKAQQVWKFTKSHQLLLREQARQHQIERQPLEGYQTRSRQDLLLSFKEELGIPDDFPVTVDLDNMQLVSAVEETLPPDDEFVPVEDLVDDAPDAEPEAEPEDAPTEAAKDTYPEAGEAVLTPVE